MSKDWDGLKIPEWLEKNFTEIVSNLHTNALIKNYTINHDCGKHLCKVEIDGKVRYPDHAEFSYKFFLEHYPNESVIANLIRSDMFVHTCSAEELENSELSKKDLTTLFVVALSEIHANAELFGGIESQSFKQKFKQISRRGNRFFSATSEKHDYIYIVVRADLIAPQYAVQASHAAIESCRQRIPNFHPSVICLTVEDENALKTVIKYLAEIEITFSIFCENDLNNTITAIATQEITHEQRKIFRKFKLLC